MTFLLDTCLISELVAKHPNQKVVDWLDDQVPDSLYISIITIGEIAKGISKLTPSKRKESLIEWLNKALPSRFNDRILGLDFSTMVFWGNLVGQLEQNGRPLPAIDSLIAAIAIYNGLSLVTRNERDFAGTGVVIINPWSL